MLVNRYFGSKEQLFAEAVDRSFAAPTVVGADPAALPAQLAAALVARTDPASEPLNPYLLMLRSAGNPGPPRSCARPSAGTSAVD
ncbi:hypothetical protein ACFQZ4_05845 [Catellatospora coxensis]